MSALVKSMLDDALGAASQQDGPEWARVRADLDDLRRGLDLADDRSMCRRFENDAIDAVYDAVSALRGVASTDDPDWPALRDARLAGIVRVLRSIERSRAVAA